jgi:hypothetical protein
LGLVYRPNNLPKLDFRCSPPEPSGGEGVGKFPGRGGGAGGRACSVFGFCTEGAGGRAVACACAGTGFAGLGLEGLGLGFKSGSSIEER